MYRWIKIQKNKPFFTLSEIFSSFLKVHNRSRTSYFNVRSRGCVSSSTRFKTNVVRWCYDMMRFAPWVLCKHSVLALDYWPTILQMMAILTLHWCGLETIAIWVLVWARNELRFYQECVGCQRPTIRAIANDAKVIWIDFLCITIPMMPKSMQFIWITF